MFNDAFGLTQAVLDGKKKITRRIISEMIRQSPFASTGWEYVHSGKTFKPKYKVGEIVAVAQSYSIIADGISIVPSVERANFVSNSMISTYPNEDYPRDINEGEFPAWNNKMFVKADLMPHQIKITNIRIERLQDISDEDCLHEGVIKREEGHGYIVNGIDRFTPHGNAIAQQVAYYYEPIVFDSPCEAFASLIDKISGKGTWESNPQTCVYEFELIK